MRRAHPRHHRNVRQPGLSQRRRHGLPAAHPLAAHAQRRHRRGHLRQRIARDDDGAGSHARSALRAGAGRSHLAGGKRGRRRTRAIRGRPLRASADYARIRRREPLSQLRHSWRRMPVPGDCGHFAGGGRGSGAVAHALGAFALGTSHLARPGAALGTRHHGSRSPRPYHPRHPDRCLHSQRHGCACGLRRIDQPHSSSAGDCPRSQAHASEG